MQKYFWFFQIPVILFFLLCFWITELGSQEYLSSSFFREKLYPPLSRAPSLLTQFKFQLRGSQAPKNKIVILEINSATLEKLGRWPWHRDRMAYLIDQVFQRGAKVVGLDLVFSEPDPRIPDDLADQLKKSVSHSTLASFETDPLLTTLIQRYANRLILGWTSEMSCQPAYETAEFCAVTDPESIQSFRPSFEKYAIPFFQTPLPFQPSKTPLLSYLTVIKNLPEYDQVAQHAGYLNAHLDADGSIRSTPLVAMVHSKPYPSLALEMARTGLNDTIQIVLDKNQRIKTIQFMRDSREIPVNSIGMMQINFRGPSSIFKHISAEDLFSEKGIIEDPLNPLLFGQSVNQILQDAYVIIGVTAIGEFDMRQFPFETQTAGVYGHAHILDNLLSMDPLKTGTDHYRVFHTVIHWIFFTMTFGTIILLFFIKKLNALSSLFLFSLAFSLIFLIDFYLFIKNYNFNTAYLYIEWIVLFIISFLIKYVTEEKNKKFIRNAFSKYVSPLVVDSILKDPQKLALGGEKRAMTILFSDIREFTIFSEKMDAKILATFLNDYLGIMTDCILEHQGTLDKYIGDAIMAFWGAPLPQQQHALHGIQTAIKMHTLLEGHQERFKKQYHFDVRIGIGLNSGIVNVGNMGSEQNFSYTVIGDQVNLASRVESLTKIYGVPLLTTRFTFDLIPQNKLIEIPYRILDHVKVKGKNNSIELIQILHRHYSKEGLCLFSEAQDFYRHQQWDPAYKSFQSASNLFNSEMNVPDQPCLVFMKRCHFFKKNPPPPQWDGCWEMNHK